jgi:hypothetical protein
MHHSESSLESLAHRLDDLEKEYRLLKSEVFTEKLVLVDGTGKPRATLSTISDRPGLMFYDEAGNTRARLGMNAQGMSLSLLNAAGQIVAEILEDKDGPRMALFDPDGNTRVSLCVTENGSFAYLFGPNGKQHLRLELFSSGGATLNMKDIEGAPSVMLATDKEKGPIIVFFKGDDVIWSIPKVDDSNSELSDDQS